MRTIALLVITLFSLTLSPVFAADSLPEKHWTTYGKVGYFSWMEWRDNGDEYIRDDGVLYAVGVTRTDRFLKHLILSETIEVWGGDVVYDGEVIATGESFRRNDNTYIGMREEVRATAEIPIRSVRFSPFVGLEHKWWSREVEDEVWDMAFTRVGARIAHVTPKTTVYIEGGAALPLYTKNHWATSDFTDFPDVVLRPKARPGAFGEMGVKGTRWSCALSYERIDFAKSDPVVLVSDTGSKGTFWQPKSSTSTGWLKIGYSF
ncbi:MAG: hypothetical protein UW32_C0002G0024 [Candidatus Wolfebacteria bacterium GW2011_GWE2_44_13]|uniref:Uncharacterized protein n=1 Tax=Candidatus Wolfebacteria bacterium GW2011_GWE2_44_13 TaxID=1619017 RepID=A0A0G1H9H6_9BACT|nr:MAG: hypothetical protein UW32_C0002G0024 [Candidatus Wolfebacteria bacterium GW2011_GWE2_44_13]